MSEAYHFPPDLLNLLIEAIPRLAKSKQDVILFFRGAGVGATILSDLERSLTKDRDSVSKFQIARTVLQRINELGDSGLRSRREIVRRVVEIEDFSRCWPNDQLAAIGLVAQIRQIVGVKDAFTRMSNERNVERRSRMEVKDAEAAEKRRVTEERESIKKDLFALYSETNPQRRGKSLEGVLNRLFNAWGISVREAFTLTHGEGVGVIEQVDGVIELAGNHYFVEMKWWEKPVDVAGLSQHMMRVFLRAESRALVISASGFTQPAIVEARNALVQKSVVLANLEEIVALLEKRLDLRKWISAKAAAASIERNPYFDAVSAGLCEADPEQSGPL